MQTLLRTCLILLAAALATPVHAAVIFEAELSGGQEVPPVASPASGFASLKLNDAMDRLEMSLQLFGLDLDGAQTPGDSSDDVVGLHIHRALAGSNGTVVFGLISPFSDINGDLVIDAFAGTVFSAWDAGEGFGTTLSAELDELMSGGLYLNVHTLTFPAGEIRGQIVQVPEPASVALMMLGAIAMAAAGLRKSAAKVGTRAW